ncbi:MAG TPA: zinc-dependent metalloprotease [Gemmataceae bacterium]|nr:zinc-dependent metalloprotease [Gemmataceae bacterium]
MKFGCWRVLTISGVVVTMLGLAVSARGQGSEIVDTAKLKEVLLGLDHEKKFEDFNKTVQGAKVHEGLFRLHQKDDKLYAEIKPEQLNKPYLCPIAIARGMTMGGYTLNFDEQWVLVFKRVGDKVQLIRRNVRYQAKAGSPLAKAVETTYTDSVLMALRIVSINPMFQSLLINLNDVFMTDFAQLGMGYFDSNRSSWEKIKTFPKNIELEVAATYGGGRGRFMGGDDGVIDPRGNTIVIHYGLVELPEFGYQPRLADDRVGHFLSAVKDFSTDSKDTTFLRHINRWRLERADTDPKNKDKLSPPKKKIVFWIEKSVPDEYRAFVREGILEWNKAFEKIGFRDAIEVRQQESEDFEPEDITYSTFRWITTDMGFAMGPSRANPLTGEILDADIIFDASMVRYWKQEYQAWRPSATGGLEEPASSIQAMQRGWSLFQPRMTIPGLNQGWNDKPMDVSQLAQFNHQTRLWAVQQGVCQCASNMKYELGLAALVQAAKGEIKPGEKIPDELIGQAIKHVVMHEVGHTLGLRHNFKASCMLPNDKLHDTSITRKQGLVGSVMDYSPINLAPKGVKQGDYFSTTLGPYDYWAIEYAYKPLSGGTDGELEELQKIAAKCATSGLDYATDEDMYGAADPLVHAWDLGNDPMKFAQERMVLAEELMKGLADRVVDKGEGYQRAREAFRLLLNQYGNAAFLVAYYVGGEYMHRDHRGDPKARDPFVPVKGVKQREALKFLQDHILNDKPFQFTPELLRKLAADRWSHWGNERMVYSAVDFPLYERILAIQRIVMEQAFDSQVLGRIQNNALKTDKDDQALTVAEVFRSVTDGVWNEPKDEGKPGNGTSIIRRNLQREHVKQLSSLVLGRRPTGDGFVLDIFGFTSRPAPPDARSLARMHLKDVAGKIEGRLKTPNNGGLDDTTRAHLEECQERIAKVLNASMQINEP